MTYTIDNINEFFDDLNNSLNPKVSKMMVYSGYMRDEKLKAKCYEATKNYTYGCYFGHYVSDDIIIVQEIKGKDTLGWYVYVNGEASYRRWITFEQALLCAVSIKLTGREDATEWMWKLVGGENNP